MAGSLLVAGIIHDGTTATVAMISDSTGCQFSRAGAAAKNSFHTIETWWCVLPAGGPETVTVKLDKAVGVAVELYLHEYRGNFSYLTTLNASAQNSTLSVGPFSVDPNSVVVGFAATTTNTITAAAPGSTTRFSCI
jgi:hypothetical protein